MKAIKRLFLKMILNKNQREIIWNAILYSEYKYKQHGDTENAIRVGVVKEEVKKVFTNPKTKYTAKEVDQIVAGAIHHTLDCVTEFVQQKLNELKEKECQMKVNIVPGVIIDREKCESCDKKDTCDVKKVVFDDDDAPESETTSETEKAQEQAEETAPQASEDNAEKAEE